jgi:di/tricarboxylate transporter
VTTENVLVLAILAGAVVLFVTERFRVDLVALLVLSSLALTGLVTPAEALSGFSSAAVVTVWAVFILSGGLSQTGVANIIGRQVLRISGQSEVQLMVVIMLTAAIMSAFMNNVGVVALLLPVVINIARQTKIPSSKLLLPLAFGALLGGMTTLIGTPPNIIASDALHEYGFEPFQFFDFAPVGLILTVAGILFMVLIGRHLLPTRHPAQSLSGQANGTVDARELYELEERLALITIPSGSRLAGKTLVESRIGRALDLIILGLQREGRKQMTVRPDTLLQENDRLLVLGQIERLEDLSSRPYLVVEDTGDTVEQLASRDIGVAELKITPDSPFIGKTISQIDMRHIYSLNVLAILRDGQPRRTNLQDLPLLNGDMLLLQGTKPSLSLFDEIEEFGELRYSSLSDERTVNNYRLQERLLVAYIPESSPLVGKSLLDSRLADTFGLVALAIIRPSETELMPSSDTQLKAGDKILVEGNPEELLTLRALQQLNIERQLNMQRVELVSADAGLVEVVLSPRTTLVNKSLRQIHFRDKFGLSVLAIWRNGRVFRSDLNHMTLQFGDAFLMYGPRQKIKLLSSEPDFLVLQEEEPLVAQPKKAPLAALIMVGVIGTVLVGWQPIQIAALVGAALMVLTGCLSMEDAYHYIDWRAVFLIAAMLPLGIAMEQTGTASLLAEGMVALVGDLGETALLAGLFILTSIVSQVMPNPVVTVLMAPIAINTAGDLGLSPYALMMVVAIAASASFMSPVGHPANVLIMGPGGYRFADYMKVGIPLTILLLLVTLLVLPIFWPLFP